MACHCDTFRSTVTDSYPANTISNNPALHEIYDPPDAPNADNADVTDSMDTSDACPANAVDVDAADATDADVFQLLSQGHASKIAVDRPPDVLEGPAEQSMDFSHFSDTSSVIVDRFPFGNPGAPIPGVPQGRSSYEQFQATQSEIWSPFQSQRDWDVARWVKTHSTSSSAVADLLAIPEVYAARLCHPLCS